MNKLSYTICLLFVAQLAYNAGVNGIDCYDCVYMETILPPGYDFNSEENCKNGQIPVTVESCTSNRNTQTKNSSFANSSLTNSTETNQESIYRCVKVIYDGNFRDIPELGNARGKAFKGIFRTCIAYDRTPQPQEGCFVGLLGSAFMDEELRDRLRAKFQGFDLILDDDTNMDVCVCGQDRCNSAFRMGGTSFLIMVVLGSIIACSKNLFL